MEIYSGFSRGSPHKTTKNRWLPHELIYISNIFVRPTCLEVNTLVFLYFALKGSAVRPWGFQASECGERGRAGPEGLCVRLFSYVLCMICMSVFLSRIRTSSRLDDEGGYRVGLLLMPTFLSLFASCIFVLFSLAGLRLSSRTLVAHCAYLSYWLLLSSRFLLLA